MNSPVTVTHPSAEMTTPVASARGPIRVLLVDDERLARQGLRDLLQEFSDVEIVGEADTAASAVAQIPALSPDVIFLDIRLPGGDGFSVLESLERVPLVVFVTAYSDYATQPSTWRLLIICSSPCVAPGWRRPARIRAEIGSEEQPPTRSPTASACARRAHHHRAAIQPYLPESRGGTSPRRCGGAFPAPHLPDARHLRAHAPSPPFLRVDRSLILNLNRLSSVEISPREGLVFYGGAEGAHTGRPDRPAPPASRPAPASLRHPGDRELSGWGRPAATIPIAPLKNLLRQLHQ